MQRQLSMALVDIGLPDVSGLDLVRLFSELAPETVCVVRTVLGDDAISWRRFQRARGAIC
ncbi:MAG: hypothetical protein RLW68_15620 [Devosia marina]|uniref:hypothetical protein n=1 Tax=Devosia marina TaxID=2683198 RepID=UPI0032EE255D